MMKGDSNETQVEERMGTGFGKRMIKTAVAVFITAWICQALEWPVMFAVITAIVTLEPTLSASVQKGLIRFPAAGVGAALAMTLDSLFGQVALTYALSAFLTIFACHLLRWHDATIVATLTAVAMIPMTSEDFLSAFLIRMGTTSIGIVVSCLVNFLLLPPNVLPRIEAAYEQLRVQTETLKQEASATLGKHQWKQIMNELDKAQELIQIQQDVYHYYRPSLSQTEKLDTCKERLEELEKELFLMGAFFGQRKKTTPPL